MVNGVGLILGMVSIEVVKRRVDVVRGPAVVRTLAVVNALLVVATAGFGLTGEFALAITVFWIVDVLRYTHQPLEGPTRATINSAVSQMDGLGAVGAVRSVAPG